MPKRSQHWEEGLAESLVKNPDERKAYFLALTNEGFSWKEALKITIESIGFKEYSRLCGVQPPYLISQISGEKDIRLSSLEKIISPIGVEIGLLDSNSA